MSGAFRANKGELMRSLRMVGSMLALGCFALSANAGFVSAFQPAAGAGVAVDARAAFFGALANKGSEPFTSFSEFAPGNGGYDDDGNPVPLNLTFQPRTTTGTLLLDASNSTSTMQILTDASAGGSDL